eukprot:scaffold149643_cov40-Tisochrysis_lutea.AAC.2
MGKGNRGRPRARLENATATPGSRIAVFPYPPPVAAEATSCKVQGGRRWRQSAATSDEGGGGGDSRGREEGGAGRGTAGARSTAGLRAALVLAGCFAGWHARCLAPRAHLAERVFRALPSTSKTVACP